MATLDLEYRIVRFNQPPTDRETLFKWAWKLESPEGKLISLQSILQTNRKARAVAMDHLLRNGLNDPHDLYVNGDMMMVPLSPALEIASRVAEGIDFTKDTVADVVKRVEEFKLDETLT